MNNQYFIDREYCPVCGSNHFNDIYSKSYNDPILVKYLNDFYNPQGTVEFKYIKGAKYTLIECNDCKLIFQKYIPNDFLMLKLYEQWLDPEIAKKESTEHDLKYFQKHAKEIMNIISFFGINPGKLKILDFGMGWGEYSLLAKSFGCNVFGSELSNERINHAELNGIKTVSWDEIPNRQFNFINTEQVFEHISEPTETLRYISKSLIPGGIIKISVPDGTCAQRALSIMDWNIPKGAKNSLNLVAPLEHINCFRTETLLKMAHECGLENYKIEFKYSIMDLSVKISPTFKEVLKNVLRPYYYKYFKQADKKPELSGTYLFFIKSIK